MVSVYKRQKFTYGEDQMLLYYVGKYNNDWNKISEQMGTRSSRQCRERYKHYLSPEALPPQWTPEEDEKLKQVYEKIGAKFNDMVSFFPGRTGSNIKNRWISLNSRRSNRKRKKSTAPSDFIGETLPQNHEFSGDIEEAFMLGGFDGESDFQQVFDNDSKYFGGDEGRFSNTILEDLPVYSTYVNQGSKISITMNGTRSGDFSGHPIPSGYTWHHLFHNFQHTGFNTVSGVKNPIAICEMEQVLTSWHGKISHKGACSEYGALFRANNPHVSFKYR